MKIALFILKMIIQIVVAIITVNIKFKMKEKQENKIYQKDVSYDIRNLYFQDFEAGNTVNKKNVKMGLERINSYSYRIKKDRVPKEMLNQIEALIDFGARIITNEDAIKTDIKIREAIEKLLC